jgi:hypothetical protein
MSEQSEAAGGYRTFFDIGAAGAIDLDQVLDNGGEASANTVADCSCGARRTILRHMAISPCAGRAMARLKAAHPAEYAGYLAELKTEALAEFEETWRHHLAGNHGRRTAR